MPLTRRTLIKQSLVAIASQPLYHAALLAQPPVAEEDPPRSSFFDGRTRRAIDAGLAYLASRQLDDGSFGSGPYRNNLAVGGLSGMAFLAAGYLPQRGKFGQVLQRSLEFVSEHAQPSGFIHTGDSQARGPMYEHGFATLFLAEVYGTSSKPAIREPLVKAIQLIVTTQNDEGGWRYEPRRSDADLSVTVCQVMALRAAHNVGIFVPKQTIDRAIDYVKRCQNDDGGFAYMANTPGESRFPRSAAALVALYNAGQYDSEELARGLEYVVQFPPQRGDLMEGSYYMYGHYYAAQAMWHAGGRFWNAWYPAIRAALLNEQRADGAWSDAISPEYGTAMACLILQMPASYLPIFER